ncbi:hypothetical protein ASG88_00900 [Nocardioides sp. Soil777]|uniref:PepSY domain-containing protein n=1 Tax=Nocardioides sp. Soil777 TaxID=1736409 RepID=UPI000702A314|nr:PepSY domain-containing protein [Nocardioides sp. Soil777]KRF07916.1 hypothetical protein ASG88_00900 [Nocardioides sp. Soil777]
MNRKKIALAGATAAALVLAGGGVAIAGGVGDDDASERPIPGPELQQAEDAALAETGGGEVTGTEVEDEESWYEVEVTLDDGTQVDVQLDEDFTVVGTESERGDEESGTDD